MYATESLISVKGTLGKAERMMGVCDRVDAPLGFFYAAQGIPTGDVLELTFVVVDVDDSDVSGAFDVPVEQSCPIPQLLLEPEVLFRMSSTNSFL